MLLQENTFEFNLFFVFIIIILIIKLLIIIYITLVILKRKRETGEFLFDFTIGVLLLIICLFLSRLFFLFFDFYLTKFDQSKYIIPSNILFWKLGMFVFSIGGFFVLFIADLKVLNFKFKGLFAYIIIATGLFQLFYPIKIFDDFVFVNSVGVIYGLIAIIIPIIFFYSGSKMPSLRNYAYSIAFGIIIFAIGGMVFNQAILDPLIQIYGSEILIVFYLLFLLLKTTGLILFAYGVVNFNV